MYNTVMRPSPRPPWLRKTSLLGWLPRATPHRVPRRIATTSARNAAPVDLPKLIIAPGSKQHNSLPSFIEYAKRVNLAPEKTVYIGTHYEYTSALALMRLGFSLLRSGRTHDAGIDLIGHWVLGPLREPLPVFMQCKSRKISANPQHIRELEGSFQGTPPDWKKKDVLGLLITTKKATRGVLEALGQSRLPMGFVLISREGTIQQFVWNRAASERGLEGVGVTIRHTPRALLAGREEEEVEEEVEEGATKQSKKRIAKYRITGTRKDIQLTWMGSPIFPDRECLDPETVELMRSIVPSDNDPPAVVVVKPKRGRPLGSTKMAALLKARTDSIEEVPVKRARGRPKGSTVLQSAKLPSPRGGQIPRASALKENRGRPKGQTNLPGGKKSGPPLGSHQISRPFGSRNRPKVPVDAG
jgi:hypothetical protein